MPIRRPLSKTSALTSFAALAGLLACAGHNKEDDGAEGGAGGEASGGDGGSDDEAAAGAGAGGGVDGLGGDTSPPIVIKPSDPRLHYIGRWDRSKPDAPVSDWAGAGIRINMRGTAVRVQVSGTAMYQVVIDGMPTSVLKYGSGAQWSDVATGLPPGPHVVELYARVEPIFGQRKIMGVEVQGELNQAQPAKHRIEFIGDSITCGYSNLYTGVGAVFSAETEDNYLAYGSLTTRALNAEASTIAWSGKRLTGMDGLPELFERTLAARKPPEWDFAQWKPEVVVINLGTNDFGAKVSAQEFIDTYEVFVNRIRQVYGDVPIFCATGPMTDETSTRAFVDKRKLTDKNVFFVEFGADVVDGFGGHGHPSLKTHANMATVLTAAIRAQTHW